MSTTYTTADPVLFDTQQIEDAGRRGILQLLVLDYNALYYLRKIKTIVTDSTQSGTISEGSEKVKETKREKETEIKIGSDQKYRNVELRLTDPYQLPVGVIKLLIDPRHDEKSDLVDAYKMYRVSLLLQELWAYPLNSTRTMFELRSLTNEDVGNLSQFETQDRIPTYELSYRKKLLQKKIISKLIEANSGMPIQDEVTNFIIKLINAFGTLSTSYVELGPEDITEKERMEEKQENELVSSFFEDSINGDTIKNIIQHAGLQQVYTELSDILPHSISGVLNSGIFSIISTIWRNVISDMNEPEIANTLLNILPRIQQQFSSVTPFDSQQDIFAVGQKLINQFLSDCISENRLKMLENLVNNPSPSRTLVTFRSLDDIEKEKLWSNSWDFKSDKLSRLNYMYLVWWSLREPKELSLILDLALKVSNLKVYRIVKDKENYEIGGKVIISSAMVPGTFEATGTGSGAGVPSGSGSLMTLDLNYDNYKRNLDKAIQSLQTPGVLQKSILSMVKWLE